MLKAIGIHGLGTSSILFTLASTIVGGIFAANSRNAVPDVGAAAFLGVIFSSINCAIVCLLVFLFDFTDKKRTSNSTSWWKVWTLFVPSLFLVAALVTTVIVFRFSDTRLDGKDSLDRYHERSLFGAWCALWSLAFILQLLFNYFSTWASTDVSQKHHISVHQSAAPTPIQLLPPRRPSLAIRPSKSNVHHLHFETNPRVNGERIDTEDSVSDRIQHGSVNGVSPARKFTQNIRYSVTSQEHGFDKWDTSSVPPEICDVLFQSHGNVNQSDNRSPKSARYSLENSLLPDTPDLRSSLPYSPCHNRPDSREKVATFVGPLQSGTTIPTTPPRIRVTAASGVYQSDILGSPHRTKEWPLENPRIEGSQVEEVFSIPKFVLAASTRSSLLAYAKRRCSVKDDDTG